MNIDRRKALAVLVGTAMGGFVPPRSFAEDLPGPALRILVGFPEGGPLDIAARLIAPVIAARLRVEVHVVNRVGNSGNDATREMVRSSPDGRTLLLCGPVNTINATLFQDLDYDFVADIAPIAPIAGVPLIVETRPDLPFTTIAELLAVMRSSPEKLRVAYAGKGTPQHLAIALFQARAGLDLDLRPYPGSAQALAALLEARADLMFDPAPSSMLHVRAGRLRALATTGLARSLLFPDLPTVAETIPGYEAGSWFGLAGPKGTPSAIVNEVSSAVAQAQRDPAFLSRLQDVDATPLVASPDEFGRFIAEETRRYAAVTKALAGQE